MSLSRLSELYVCELADSMAHTELSALVDLVQPGCVILPAGLSGRPVHRLLLQRFEAVDPAAARTRGAASDARHGLVMAPRRVFVHAAAFDSVCDLCASRVAAVRA